MNEPRKLKPTTQLLAEVVADSGFPFQAKVQAVIESRNDWKVLGTELSWRHEGEEHFIDLIAYQGNIHFVIECKKVAKLHRPKNTFGKEWAAGTSRTSYVFLRRTTKHDTDQLTTRALVTYCPDELDEVPYSGRVFGAQAQEWNLNPPSVEASLCVTVDVEDPRAFIERDVANLVRGCHEYAGAVYSDASNYGAPTNEIFVPLLVTTAQLYVAMFNPDNVNIADGDYALDPANIESVPWVRFKKAFMAESGAHSDVRTVFVVQSASLGEFLNQFSVAHEPRTTS